jgi:transcription initiation factor TFIID TATA-box-binding protein
MDDPEVVNIVAVADLGRELALQAVFDDLDGVEAKFDPADNHWLQTWLGPNDRYTAFYKSGRCMTAGLTSLGELEEMSAAVFDVFGEMLDLDEPPPFQVTNFVAVARLDLPYALEELAIMLGLEQVEYEPEQFPALIWRPPSADHDFTLLVFSSGKVVCSGLTSRDAIEDALTSFEQQLTEPA